MNHQEEIFSEMALPNSFNSSEKYMREVVGFLKEYRWIFEYANVQILSRGVFEKMPRDWLRYLEDLPENEDSWVLIHNLGLGIIEDNAPNTMKRFFEEVERFKPIFQDCTYEEPEENNVELRSGNLKLPLKKRHEIMRLSNLIKDLCDRGKNIEFGVDIGTGLVS